MTDDLPATAAYEKAPVSVAIGEEPYQTQFVEKKLADAMRDELLERWSDAIELLKKVAEDCEKADAMRDELLGKLARRDAIISSLNGDRDNREAYIRNVEAALALEGVNRAILEEQKLRHREAREQAEAALAQARAEVERLQWMLRTSLTSPYWFQDFEDDPEAAERELARRYPAPPAEEAQDE